MEWTNFAWHAGALFFLVWLIADILKANRRLRSFEEGLVPVLVQAVAANGSQPRVLSVSERARFIRGCRFLLDESLQMVPGRSLARVVVPLVQDAQRNVSEHVGLNAAELPQLQWGHVGPALCRLYDLLEGCSGRLHGARLHAAGVGGHLITAQDHGFLLGDGAVCVSVKEAVHWLRNGVPSGTAIDCVLEATGQGGAVWRLTLG